MKFNTYNLGVLAMGLIAFLLVCPKTESAFVDTIVIADILGRLRKTSIEIPKREKSLY